MDEYIEREAALNAISRGLGCGNVCSRSIRRIPTADVMPVVHARWVKLGEADYQCSSCGFRFTSGDDISEFKHCRCGAKMDGERRNDGEKL